jgi:hypothetical protein
MRVNHVLLLVPAAAFVAALYAAPQLPCTLTVESAVKSPQSHIGDSVYWKGNVREVVSSNTPVKIAIKTGKYEWLASVYEADSLDEKALVPNTTVFVSGTLYGAEDVTIEGVTNKVPAISATRVSCKQRKRPPPPKEERAPQHKVPKATPGYKDK